MLNIELQKSTLIYILLKCTKKITMAFKFLYKNIK